MYINIDSIYIYILYNPTSWSLFLKGLKNTCPRKTKIFHVIIYEPETKNWVTYFLYFDNFPIYYCFMKFLNLILFLAKECYALNIGIFRALFYFSYKKVIVILYEETLQKFIVKPCSRYSSLMFCITSSSTND